MSAIYRAVIKAADPAVPQALRPFWQHPAGPKTIFFWAPAFKWGLVIAGIGDLQRPAEKLSLSQSGSLAATGLIWSRYSLVIVPKNYSLFAVNVFVAATQCYQFYRAIAYAQSQKVVEKI
ncbi:mitochondrial pyruvate carrier 2-like [Arctopsyche grandis]|uniref:mitochondrial pyruvate carrier 2-like n=1 Tax=Arctopsyche grandis TaxID=121162 RepID=UPI00406D8705